LATVISYISAFYLKTLEIRARPGELLDNINIRETAGSFGVPSGHAASATALAIILYQYVPAKFHKYITIATVGVFFSRLYLGVHLPLDILAGFAVGLTVASAVSYIFGSHQDNKISPKRIKAKVIKLGIDIKTIAFLKADARGSVPYVATDTSGNSYFIKVVSQDNYISDWLFKIYRRIAYRRLEDEAPFLSPKRQIEHESYVAGLAHAREVRTPLIYGVFKVSDGAYGQVQQGIQGKSLDKLSSKELNDSVLKNTWLEVKKLHDSSIIHRDLRAANVFLDDNNMPWIIDFGFAEAAVDETQLYRDIVELIASTTLIVGAKRAVKAAVEVEGKDRVVHALPYMQPEAMSSATAKMLKQQKGLLQEIRKQMIAQTGSEEIKPFRLKRYNLKYIFIVVAIALAAYALVPQLDNFEASVVAIKDADISFILLSLLFSLGTYFAATMVYKSISVVSLPLFRTLLVQFSSSFTNRLLPASVGGLATFGRYLYKQGNTKAQVGALLALNNFLGFSGLVTILLVISVVTGTPFSDVFKFDVPRYAYWIAAGIVVAVLALIGALPKIRNKIIKTIREIKDDVQIVAARPARLGAAFVWSMTITGFYAVTMFVVIHALGQEATLLQALVVMTIGVASAAATPTPGGIGGAEAGLTAALATIGISVDVGLGIALIYRLVTYWIPILPGFIAFQIALKKQII
jgi:undecaprenyl-diphosphatase